MDLTKLKKWFRRVSGGAREREEETRTTPDKRVKGAPEGMEKPSPRLSSPGQHTETSRVVKPRVAKRSTAKPSLPKPRARALSRQGIPLLRPDEDLERHFMTRADPADDALFGEAAAASAPGERPAIPAASRPSPGKGPKAAPHRNRAGIRQLDSRSDLDAYFLSTGQPPPPPSRQPTIQVEVDRPPKTGRRPVIAAATDRHGIPRLDDRADVRRYFETALEGEEDRASAEVLGEAFQASLDHDARRLMKKKTDGFFAPRRLTLKEKLHRYPAPQAQLDLHGDTALIARQRADSFLRTAVAAGSLTVRLIVGKGLHSESGAVLPDVVEDLLFLMKREGLVLTYRWDKGAKRKSGAVIVYLEPPF